MRHLTAALAALLFTTGALGQIMECIDAKGAKTMAQFCPPGTVKEIKRRWTIDVIAGTSMGAIVGGLYASGMDAEALSRELRTLRWSDVFAARVERRALSQRDRKSTRLNSSHIPLSRMPSSA